MMKLALVSLTVSMIITCFSKYSAAGPVGSIRNIKDKRGFGDEFDSMHDAKYDTGFDNGFDSGFNEGHRGQRGNVGAFDDDGLGDGMFGNSNGLFGHRSGLRNDRFGDDGFHNGFDDNEVFGVFDDPFNSGRRRNSNTHNGMQQETRRECKDGRCRTIYITTKDD